LQPLSSHQRSSAQRPDPSILQPAKPW
jgi:hypothetical protein